MPCLAALGLTACAVGDPQRTASVTDTGATLHGDVYSSLDGDTEYIWSMDSNGNHATNLTNTPSSFETSPAWSPDRSKIAFHTLRDGSDASEICVMGSDGSGEVNFTEHLADDTSPDWSTLP